MSCNVSEFCGHIPVHYFNEAFIMNLREYQVIYLQFADPLYCERPQKTVTVTGSDAEEQHSAHGSCVRGHRLTNASVGHRAIQYTY